MQVSKQKGCNKLLSLPSVSKQPYNSNVSSIFQEA